MNYQLMTNSACVDYAIQIIETAEGFDPVPSDRLQDSKATLGYGYTFNRSNNVALFKAAGIPLTTTQWALLTAIDNAPSNNKTALGMAFPILITESQAESLLRALLDPTNSPVPGLAFCPSCCTSRTGSTRCMEARGANLIQRVRSGRNLMKRQWRVPSREIERLRHSRAVESPL
jgi:hypothetical protein